MSGWGANRARSRRGSVTFLVAAVLFAGFLTAAIASARLAADLATTRTDRAQFKAPQTAFGRSSLSQPAGRRYTCDEAPSIGGPPSSPPDDGATAPAIDTAEQEFQDALKRGCSTTGLPTEPGNVIQTWSFGGGRGGYTATLTTQFVVPTGNWIVNLARDGAAATRPQQFAALLLGDSAPFQFRAPQISQAPIATTASVSPTASSPASVAAPAPSPSISTATPAQTRSSPSASATPSSRIPAALPTVTSPPVTTVSVTGTEPLDYGGTTSADLQLSDLVTRTLALSRRLVVNAGPARIVSVSGAEKTTLQDGQTITSTLASDSDFVSIELELPKPASVNGQPVVLTPAQHSGQYPNFYGVDSLVFSILSVLNLVAVIWVIRRWRGRIERHRSTLDPAGPEAAALTRAQRRLSGVLNVATVAVTLSVATGLLNSLQDWEYRYGQDWFPGDFVELFVPGSQLAAVILLAVAVPALMRRSGRAVARPSTLADSQRLRMPATMPCLTTLVLALGAGVALWAATVIHRGLAIDWGAPDSSNGTVRQLIAVDVGVVVAVVCLLAWWFARTWPARPDGRMTVAQLLGTLVGTAIILVLGAEARVLYPYGGSAVVTVVAVVPAIATGLAMLYAGELLLVGVSGRPVTWRRPPEDDDDTGEVRWISRHGAWFCVALAVLAVVVAIPGAQSARLPAYRLDWFTDFQALYEVRSILSLVVIAVLAYTMRAEDRDVGTIGQPAMLRTVRILGGCLAVLLWSSSAAWWYVPISFAVSVAAVWYLLLPRSRLVRAEALLSIDEAAQNRALAAMADAPPMRKALDSKIATALASIDADNAEDVAARTAALRVTRDQLRPVESTVAGIRVEPEELCFSHAAGISAWHRARVAARDATLVASPWIFLSIRADVSRMSTGYHYRVGQFLLAVPFDVLWWTGLGLLFGWAFPVIRGVNGLAKAFALLATIAVPMLAVDLFPGPPTRHQFVNSVQTVAEAASVLLILGLLADYGLLKRAGFGFAKLVEMRRLSAVVTWATSVVVAIGVAVTSIIVTGVTGALTYLSHPNVQSPNGASTSQTTGTSSGN